MTSTASGSYRRRLRREKLGSCHREGRDDVHESLEIGPRLDLGSRQERVVLALEAEGVRRVIELPSIRPEGHDRRADVGYPGLAVRQWLGEQPGGIGCLQHRLDPVG